jgi:hypothetical protein
MYMRVDVYVCACVSVCVYECESSIASDKEEELDREVKFSSCLCLCEFFILADGRINRHPAS